VRTDHDGLGAVWRCETLTISGGALDEGARRTAQPRPRFQPLRQARRSPTVALRSGRIVGDATPGFMPSGGLLPGRPGLDGPRGCVVGPSARVAPAAAGPSRDDRGGDPVRPRPRPATRAPSSSTRWSWSGRGTGRPPSRRTTRRSSTGRAGPTSTAPAPLRDPYYKLVRRLPGPELPQRPAAAAAGQGPGALRRAARADRDATTSTRCPLEPMVPPRPRQPGGRAPRSRVPQGQRQPLSARPRGPGCASRCGRGARG